MKIVVPNESRLPLIYRLGLAWCRLNLYEWDDIVGPKPPGFDGLATTSKKSIFKKKPPCKQDYICGPMEAIESVIGRTTISCCWWLFVLKKSEHEWRQWFLSTSIKGVPQKPA